MESDHGTWRFALLSYFYLAALPAFLRKSSGGAGGTSTAGSRGSRIERLTRLANVAKTVKKQGVGVDLNANRA